MLEPDRRLSTHRRTSFPSLIKVGDYRGISFLELLAPGIAGDRGRWRRFVEEGYFVYILYCGFFKNNLKARGSFRCCSKV